MMRFIGKLILITFCVILIITFLQQQNDIPSNQVEMSDPQIILTSNDLYTDLTEQSDLEVEEELVNQVDEDQSVTYFIAQWVEKSGLMIYEGIITILTDLAKVI